MLENSAAVGNEKDERPKYLKFPLYTDRQTEMVGLEGLARDDAVFSRDKIVRSTAVDEDYGTDDGILANTRRICKRDLLDTYN